MLTSLEMLRFGQNITKSHFGKKTFSLSSFFFKKKAIISFLYLYQRLKQILMKVNVKPCHVHLLSKEHEVSFFPNKTWHDTNLTRMPLDENYFAEEPLKS